jgi:ParB-like nuclease domain
MGQMVYVLMVLEGGGKVKEWRPYAVTTNPDLAEQYYSEYTAAGANVDWVPLELDDFKNVEPEKLPRFQPRTPTPGEERAKALVERMQAIIDRMQKIIDDQAKQIKQKSAAGDKMPPKPAGFEDELYDARDIASYIETWAIYEVDPEFVEEQFRGCHAVLKLLPIAQLVEGNPEHHKQSPANERKYQRMDVKTLPPILVRGEDISLSGKNEVIDGNHRLRAAMKRGLTHLWAYVVNLNGEEEADGDADAKSGR